MIDQEISQETEVNEQAGEGEGETPPEQPTELSLLKQRAKMLGISHSGNIGLEALRAKVAEKLSTNTGTGDGDEQPVEEEEPEEVVEDEPEIEPEIEEADEVPSEENQVQESQVQEVEEAPAPISALNPLAGDRAGQVPASKMTKRQQLIRESMVLVRCRITNLDPKKKDLPGEVLCVGNRMIGMVKKFIPYGEVTDDGYHIPKILYDELESRRFLHIQTSKNKANGQIQVKTSYAKEFAIEVLPQLTADQLAKLAAAQLASNG